MQENNEINIGKWNKEILIKDNDIVVQQKSFLEHLSKQSEEYKCRISKRTQEWDEVVIDSSKKEIGIKLDYYEKFKDEIIFLQPEKISRKSPMTVFNGEWGSGKTYFLEDMLKNIAKEEIDLKNNELIKFEKFIMLNAWDFSMNKNIPNDLVIKIYYILISQRPKKKYQLIYDCVKLFGVTIAFGLINVIDNIPVLKNITTPLNDTYESVKEFHESKLINKLKEQLDQNEMSELKSGIEFENTLIIIDNVERLGKNSWEIIKALSKLKSYKNLTFLLPMNINVFNDMKNVKTNEYSIDKFIDIPIYNFKQDYLTFLQNSDIKHKELIKDFDSLLNENVDGRKISIRRLEKLIIKNDIGNREELIDLIYFYKNIWNPHLKMSQILPKYIKTFFVEFLQFREVVNNFAQTMRRRFSILKNYKPIMENIEEYESSAKNMETIVNLLASRNNLYYEDLNQYIETFFELEEIKYNEINKNLWDLEEFFNSYDITRSKLLKYRKKYEEEIDDLEYHKDECFDIEKKNIIRSKLIEKEIKLESINTKYDKLPQILNEKKRKKDDIINFFSYQSEINKEIGEEWFNLKEKSKKLNKEFIREFYTTISSVGLTLSDKIQIDELLHDYENNNGKRLDYYLMSISKKYVNDNMNQ